MIDNLTDLKYFLEVAKTGNITRASERLGVTQPSITLALKRLEEKTGILLLERSRKGTSLTRHGETLFKIGERMLTDWERDTRMIAQGQTEPMGRYSLGVHSAVAQYTLSEFMPQLLEKYPALEFDLFHDLSRKITEQVISRECDLGLVINSIPHPDLVIVKLLSDEVTLFKHPAYKGDVLILDPALKQAQTLLKNVRKVFAYNRVIHSSSLEVIRNLCEHKAGIAILPNRVASLSKEIRSVAGAPTFKDELSLIYRVERKSDLSFKALVSTIKSVF
ncbi:MAG: LysR family transcriptional regulator [Bdellovibrionales bacterium]|nr:LysR family transcriptional regulator [Bdellovibrionales bacterium]